MIKNKKNKRTGQEKAAIFLASLGSEVSAEVFKYLHDDEIEKITLEIARLGKIKNFDRDQVFTEFQQGMYDQNYIFRDGFYYAKNILEKALGSERALFILNNLKVSLQIGEFDFNFLRHLNFDNLFSLLEGEHPQVIALFLSNLDPAKSSQILTKFDVATKKEIVKRMAKITDISPDILPDLNRALEKKMVILTSKYSNIIGEDIISKVLGYVDGTTREIILDSLSKDHPNLVEKIEKEFFLFQNIFELDNNLIKKVLAKTNKHNLAKALKGVESRWQVRFFQNLSKEMAESLKEEMALIGPLSLKEVEKAQQIIIDEINNLNLS